MRSYLLVLVIASVVTAAMIPLLIAIGMRIGAVDDTRDPPVPRIGGWALSLGTVLSLLSVGLVFHPTSATLLATSRSIGPVALGALGMLGLGAIDDMRPLDARLKLVAQVVLATVVFLLGVKIELLSSPFGGPLNLGTAVSWLATVVWLVGISNAFNFLDGADGVAAGSAFFASAAMFVVSVTLGHPAIGLVTAALAGALLGFLPFNFPPARVYLGDSGSLLIGFLLAGLAVEGATKGPTLVVIGIPLLAFGVPVLDTLMAVVRRSVRGRPWTERDHDHVHHQLSKAGLSARQVALAVYAASLAFAIGAMLFINPGARFHGVALVVVGAALWLIVRNLRLHELNELARLGRRGVLQPRAIVLNVQLRRAVEKIQAATDFEQLKEALGVLLQRSEFDDVILVAAPLPERRGATRTWRLFDGRFVEERSPRGADEWEVVCPFEGLGWLGELHLRRRLGKRSLLLDLNLVLELVQPALADVARRMSAASVFGA